MSKRAKRVRTLIKKMTILGEKLSPEIIKRYNLERFIPAQETPPEPAIVKEAAPEPIIEAPPEPVVETPPEVVEEVKAQPKKKATVAKRKPAAKKAPAKQKAPKKRRAKKATPKSEEQ